MVDKLRRKYNFNALLKVSNLKRSTFYYYTKNISKTDKYKDIKNIIQEIYSLHKGRYGYRRIHLALKNQGHKINHKTVYKLMKELGLKSLVRPKKYKSYKGTVGKVAPNIINRDFESNKPNTKWVTDISEFKVGSKKLYLSPILDLYNREIISYSLSESPNFNQVRSMLNQAFDKYKDLKSLILHSDQGYQYQLKQYQQMLLSKGIIQSMSRKGNCLDNSVMENFFGLLKSELFYLEKFKNIQELKIAIDEYIYYYNNYRIKENLKGQSPINFRTSSLLTA
nr:IS3 family transposase [Anaerosphaera multitolerans]